MLAQESAFYNSRMTRKQVSFVTSERRSTFPALFFRLTIHVSTGLDYSTACSPAMGAQRFHSPSLCELLMTNCENEFTEA